MAPDFSRVAQKTASKQHYAPVEIIKQPASEQGDYDYYYEDDSSVNLELISVELNYDMKATVEI